MSKEHEGVGLVPLDDVCMMFAALRQTESLPQVPKPFSEPICMVDEAPIMPRRSQTYEFDRLALTLKPGDQLSMVRDPLNAQDRWAIRVLTPDGEHLGFFPADDAQIVARLMDGGKYVYGTLVRVEHYGRMHHTRPIMAVYLDD